MKIYFLRHAEADHLLENWNQKVDGNIFIQKLKEWQYSKLTKDGIESIDSIKKSFPDDFHYIFHSKLERCCQTTDFLNEKKIKTIPCDELIEIMLFPPKFMLGFKFSIRRWMLITGFLSLLNFKSLKIIKETRVLLKKISKKNSNTLCVSHEARIFSILVYCYFNFKWKIEKTDLSPLGLTVISKR